MIVTFEMKSTEPCKSENAILTMKRTSASLMFMGCSAPRGTGALHKMHGVKRRR